MLRTLTHQRTAEFQRITVGEPRHLVHEAFHENTVLIGIHTAPRTDRQMRIAHRVFGTKVGMGVTDLGIAFQRRPQALQLADVLAVLDRRRIGKGIDRLARYPDMQSCEIALLVDTGREAALRDRPVKVMGLVFFAGPHHFHRRTGEGLGNGHALAHHVLVADAPAEAAAQIHDIGFAFLQRHSRCARQRRQRGFQALGRNPDLGLVR